MALSRCNTYKKEKFIINVTMAGDTSGFLLYPGRWFGFPLLL
jgi:hypothetical protein